jgi:hypothetical protein
MHRDVCGECTLLHSRRDFVRTIGAAVATALAASGAARDAGAMLPVSTVDALHVANTTFTYPLPPADGTQITALRWNEGQHRFKCPKHNSRYEPDGTFVDGRATRGMDRFAVRRDGNTIVVDVEKMFKQDADPAGWAAATIHLT